MRWKSLFAVLLGLLVITMGVGSVSATVYRGVVVSPENPAWVINATNVTNVNKNIFISPSIIKKRKETIGINKEMSTYPPYEPEPEWFFDEDQVTMSFNKSISYSYKGIVYLAFTWHADIGYNSIPNAGTPDKIVILIPWEVNKTTGFCQEETSWCQLMQDDKPSVYVEAPNEDAISVQVPNILIEKKVGRTAFRFREVIIEVPENLVNEGTIYVGFTPITKFYGSKLPFIMAYIHTWQWIGSGTLTALLTLSALFPPSSPLGSLILTGTINLAVYELGPSVVEPHEWMKSTSFNKISITPSDYPERTSPQPPCFKGICPVNLYGGNAK
ncbi:hypothetical protein [Thermococcus sp.]|uniref:hypothetical protein n=1 Tax=Thermococcus sp. TaxID=35749 RepID=UPI00263371E1|nr:hypothetical protein [Thermococcus sp.]